MMNGPRFSVVTTSHFDRLLKKLVRAHSDLVSRFEEAATILSEDPFNKSRRYAIKKLVSVAAGEGQYRLHGNGRDVEPTCESRSAPCARRAGEGGAPVHRKLN